MSNWNKVFKYYDYQDGPDVPVVMPSLVGGVYRVGPGVIQVTFLSQMISDQQRIAKAVVHQVWNEEAFVTAQRLLNFATEHLERPPLPRKRLLKTVN